MIESPKFKYRWSFVGEDKNGNEIFPETAVRLNRRPYYPYAYVRVEGSELFRTVYIPGEIALSTKSPETRFNESLLEVVSGTLAQYFEQEIVERWVFKDISVKSVQQDEEQEEWVIAYKTCDYTPEDLEKERDWI